MRKAQTCVAVATRHSKPWRCGPDAGPLSAGDSGGGGAGSHHLGLQLMHLENTLSLFTGWGGFIHICKDPSDRSHWKISKESAESWSSDLYVPICEGEKNEVEIKGGFHRHQG